MSEDLARYQPEDLKTLEELVPPGEDSPGWTINRYNFRLSVWSYYADDHSIRRIWGDISWFVDLMDLCELEEITFIECRRDGRRYQFIRDRRPRALTVIRESNTADHASAQGFSQRDPS